MNSPAKLRRERTVFFVRNVVAFVAAVTAFCILSGCGNAPRDLSRDEARLAAWWCEDWVRGIDRNPGELRTVDASVSLNRIADWVDSRNSTATHHLTARHQRWNLIQAFLRSGSLSTNSDGLLVVTPGSTDDTQVLVQRIADTENKDRRTVEVLCLTFAQTDDALTKRFKEEFRAARIAGDATVSKQSP